jgi:hypothetical protein
MHGESTAKAESLRKWTRAYMANRNDIPVNLYGKCAAADLERNMLEALDSVDLMCMRK